MATMIQAWRIVNHRHAKTAFAGEGARLYGGRWNSAGTAMVYAAQSQSLANLEMLVHLESPELLKKYVIFGIEIDTALIASVDQSALPRDWKAYPVLASVQVIGDHWAASLSSAVLSVPSVLVSDESNFLLNPLHPDFPKLKIHKPLAFQFDSRLTKRHRKPGSRSRGLNDRSGLAPSPHSDRPWGFQSGHSDEQDQADADRMLPESGSYHGRRA